METVVLNILTPVRMTTCPPRLQIKTLWAGAILTGKMTFLRAKYLAKVVNTMETVALNIKLLSGGPPVLPDSNSQTNSDQE